MTHVVIDDFFNDPHAIRETALSLAYPARPEGALYPGRNAGAALSFPGIERLVGSIVHEPLVPAPNTSYGHPRIALEGDRAGVSVHIDICHWSAIAYLSLDEHCRGGTHFFRHKATGLDMAPVFPEMAKAAGYPDSRTALERMQTESSRHREHWDEVMMIPMKFNRIVIFRGYLWHDAGVSFGDRPENARLILPFFFRNTEVG